MRTKRAIKKTPTPKIGDLRVWWIPQMPGKPFHYPVPDVKTAKVLYDALAMYDLFQYNNSIKPDFANAGGLEVYETIDEDADPDGGPGEWCEWNDVDGYDIGEVLRNSMEETK